MRFFVTLGSPENDSGLFATQSFCIFRNKWVFWFCDHRKSCLRITASVKLSSLANVMKTTVFSHQRVLRSSPNSRRHPFASSVRLLPYIPVYYHCRRSVGQQRPDRLSSFVIRQFSNYIFTASIRRLKETISWLNFSWDLEWSTAFLNEFQIVLRRFVFLLFSSCHQKRVHVILSRLRKPIQDFSGSTFPFNNINLAEFNMKSST